MTKKPCHHPQGGFCPNCECKGLAPIISREDSAKIDTLAAHFVEDSQLLLSLSDALHATITRHVERDRTKRGIRYAEENAYTPE